MRLRLLSGLLAAAAIVAGCPGIGDIDRTQPDKVQKSIFKNADGSPKEYFFRQTIIDVPATNGTTFIGEQGDTERVVFEVSEDFLYAYRSYGHLQDTDNGAIAGEQGDGYVRPGTGPYHGAPIAAYPIQSHFDVQRQYNAATGEQSNVLVENTNDRPWNEREFMRVQWGSNFIADFRFGGASSLQATISRDIQEQDDNKENTKDRPVVTEDYIDLVMEMHVVPEHYDFRAYGYGLIPVCYFYDSIYKDCLGGTVKVRSSFVPVDKLPRYAGEADGKSDYVAMDYDDLRFQKFGFFRTERYRFDDQYGVVEPAQIRLANRWNIWNNAADCYDPELAKPYSKCTPDQIRPIVYYLNEDFPFEIKEMHDMTAANGEAWNELFKSAVQSSTGWTDAEVADLRIFTMCPNNPVQKGDPSECGAEGLSPQIGDLRYSMYYYIPNWQDSSPLGYGPSATDPFTGEIIQGNAFYYGAPAVTIAARTIDIVKFELGILDNEDLSDGLPAREAVSRTLNPASIPARGITGGNIHEQVVRLADNLNIKQKGQRLRQQVQRGQASVDQRRSRDAILKTSGLDELALTDEIREAFGAHVLDAAVSPADADAVIAARLFNNDVLFGGAKDRMQRRLMTPQRSCVLLAEDVFDEGLLGLTRDIRSRFFDITTSPASLKTGVTEQDVINYMVANTMGDTQLHEIGHTMGLRHNFAGSTDALNFGPEYWALRGSVREAGEERPILEYNITENGNDRIALNLAIENGMRDIQDSSVMDYASTYGTKTELGKYDLAAIKYAYGDVVEVFNNPNMTGERAALLKQGELHYMRYPEVVSNGADFASRITDMYDRSDVNFRQVKKLTDLEAGDAVEVPYVFCSDEYRDASATCALWDQGVDNFERTHYAVQKYRSYRVFNSFKRERLTFGIDIFSYLSRIYGREFTYMLNQYKNWVNDELIIRSDKPCLVVENGQVVVESDDRFVSPSCGEAGFVGTVETVNLMSDVLASPDVGCYARLTNGCYDTVVGNASTFAPPDDADLIQVSSDPAFCDTFVPTQPAGTAGRRIALKVTDKTPYLHVRDSESCERINDISPIAYVPPEVRDAGGNVIANAFLKKELLDDGENVRPSNTLYDRERYGYYFYIKPTVMGSWWEKWLAVKAIGDGNTDFIGVDASSDTRSFLISLNTLFGDDLNNLIGSTITENFGNYAPVVRPNGKLEVLPLLNLATGGPIDRAVEPGAPLNPDQQYTFRLVALFNSAYNGQYTDDYEFGESIAIGMAHNVTDITVPDAVRADPTRYTEVTDPVTNIHYYALHQQRNGAEDLYSIGYEYLRQIKQAYYVGGADGPGTDLLPAYSGQNEFEPRGDLEIAQIMATTAATFGYADVWSGDLGL